MMILSVVDTKLVYANSDYREYRSNQLYSYASRYKEKYRISNLIYIRLFTISRTDEKTRERRGVRKSLSTRIIIIVPRPFRPTIQRSGDRTV